MISINMKILIANVAICTFFILSFAQYAFADEALCGIGRDITTSERKETYQQQTDQITNLINTLTGAVGGILGGIGGGGETRISNEIVEELLSLFLTMATTGTQAQGYVCIPQNTYNELIDNLSSIILQLR